MTKSFGTFVVFAATLLFLQPQALRAQPGAAQTQEKIVTHSLTPQEMESIAMDYDVFLSDLGFRRFAEAIGEKLSKTTSWQDETNDAERFNKYMLTLNVRDYAPFSYARELAKLVMIRAYDIKNSGDSTQYEEFKSELANFTARMMAFKPKKIDDRLPPYITNEPDAGKRLKMAQRHLAFLVKEKVDKDVAIILSDLVTVLYDDQMALKVIENLHKEEPAPEIKEEIEGIKRVAINVSRLVEHAYTNGFMGQTKFLSRALALSQFKLAADTQDLHLLENLWTQFRKVGMELENIQGKNIYFHKNDKAVTSADVKAIPNVRVSLGYLDENGNPLDPHNPDVVKKGLKKNFIFEVGKFQADKSRTRIHVENGDVVAEYSELSKETLAIPYGMRPDVDVFSLKSWIRRVRSWRYNLDGSLVPLVLWAASESMSGKPQELVQSTVRKFAPYNGYSHVGRADVFSAIAGSKDFEVEIDHPLISDSYSRYDDLPDYPKFKHREKGQEHDQGGPRLIGLEDFAMEGQFWKFGIARIDPFAFAAYVQSLTLDQVKNAWVYEKQQTMRKNADGSYDFPVVKLKKPIFDPSDIRTEADLQKLKDAFKADPLGAYKNFQTGATEFDVGELIVDKTKGFNNAYDNAVCGVHYCSQKDSFIMNKKGIPLQVMKDKFRLSARLGNMIFKNKDFTMDSKNPLINPNGLFVQPFMKEFEQVYFRAPTPQEVADSRRAPNDSPMNIAIYDSLKSLGLWQLTIENSTHLTGEQLVERKLQEYVSTLFNEPNYDPVAAKSVFTSKPLVRDMPMLEVSGVRQLPVKQQTANNTIRISKPSRGRSTAQNQCQLILENLFQSSK